MNGRHAICLVVDGLRASALGAYGNTTSSTPQLDDLASRSAVVEWLWADSPHLDRIYRSMWRGVHALRPERSGQASWFLPELLRQEEVPVRLLTDEPWLTQQANPEPFDQIVGIDTQVDQSAASISETSLAQFCSAAVDHMEQWQADASGSLVWLHTRGLCGAWDAPPDLRCELLEEDDPPAAEFLEPPEAIRNVEDPDQLHVFRTAYAAQVNVVDTCVGALWQAIDEMMSDRETLFMLIGSRGFALGEHGSVGSECRELFGERLHLPWLLHMCGEETPPPRLTGLTQPADVGAALLDWFGVSPPEGLPDGQSLLPCLDETALDLRELAIASGDQRERALRTPAWMFRQVEADQPQLFSKPDDRWECNDVAVRCPEIVDRFGELLAEVERDCLEDRPLPRVIEDEQLINPPV
ncbi:MAG: sulfatase-like hydrolase/transferase [Pirellulales bacterium]|nr:sulfatase-like hydrolase/transferase [Pirellulales bacterium]